MSLFLIAIALLLAGALAAIVLRRHRSVDSLVLGLVLAGCLAIGAVAIRTLIRDTATMLTWPSNLPGGDWVIGVDPLSAVFLLIISVVGAAGTLFGTTYYAPERTRPVWLVHSVYALELVALSLVVTAQAVVPFLCAWEAMAIGSYLLIMFDHEHDEVRRAGLIYITATHTGTLALFAMFALWSAPASDWSFAALAAAAPDMAAGGTAVLAFGLVGFGFKAGVVPLHFWLPPAHSSAPTHVSALLSGVVIKTGVYGILRMLMLLGAPPAWWGWSLLALGGISSVLGVTWALAQHDLKRLLAYHSVENIGIIVIGIGVGSLGSTYGHPAVAALGYAGAVLHTLNHALFKGLLFLGAGAVQRATGTRRLEALGGLARRLPYTWLFFLIGATAIIGVPPLNGFVSEWLVYVGLFRAAQAESLKLASLGVPLLAFAGALALACFAKVAGTAFLGTARSEGGATAREVPRGMLGAMFALAAGCVLLGLLPGLGVAPSIRIATTVGHLPVSVVVEAGGIGQDATRIGALAFALILMVAVAALVRHFLLRRTTVRAASTWACGYPLASPRMQYTASSFAAPLVSAFSPISGVSRHQSADVFETHPSDLVLDRAVAPAWRSIHRAALRLRPIQQGRLHVYLIYVMLALLALLAYLALVT